MSKQALIVMYICFQTNVSSSLNFNYNSHTKRSATICVQQERINFGELHLQTKEQEKTDEVPKKVKTKKSFFKFLHSFLSRKRNKPVQRKHIKQEDIGSDKYYLAKQ